MGIGRAIALGGLGRGLAQAGQDYEKERHDQEREDRAEARLKEQASRDNVSLLANVAREGGYVGNLPSGYNPDGTVQTGLSAQRPGAYVGASTASTQTPYATETNYSRPMKKIGTVNDQDVWVPADGMSPDAYERSVQRQQKTDQFNAARERRKATVAQFKYTRPDQGLVAALDDPEKGDDAFQMLLKAEMEADPAYQARQVQIAGARAGAIANAQVPAKEAVKKAPGTPRQVADKLMTERRIALRQNFTEANQMMQNAGTQQKAANKALSGTDGSGGLRGQYANMGDDTTGVAAQNLRRQIGSLQADSANAANTYKTYQSRAKAYDDSLAMPNLGLRPDQLVGAGLQAAGTDSTAAPTPAPAPPPVAAAPAPPAVSPAEVNDYAQAAQKYQHALSLPGIKPADAQQAYALTIKQIATKYGHPPTP